MWTAVSIFIVDIDNDYDDDDNLVGQCHFDVCLYVYKYENLPRILSVVFLFWLIDKSGGGG